MDEINEQTENMKQIQEALSAPIGTAADFDEVCILVMNIFFLAGFIWSQSGYVINIFLPCDEIEC